MSQIVLIIIGAVIIVLLLFLLTRRGRESVQKTVGICATALGQDARKQENKEKILTLLRDRGELSNSDIREALGVSERSAVRYMDELEKEDKAEQVGRTGRDVVYRLKP